MGNVLNFGISILESKLWQKGSAIEKNSNLTSSLFKAYVRLRDILVCNKRTPTPQKKVSYALLHATKFLGDRTRTQTFLHTF